MTAFVYMLRCSDGSYYIGCTTNLEKRLGQHDEGASDGYTFSRRPVVLVYACEFFDVRDDITAERRMKRWSRAKKEAVIRDAWEELPALAKRGFRPAVVASFETAALRPPQDD